MRDSALGLASFTRAYASPVVADLRAERGASGPHVFSRAAFAYNRVGPQPFTHFARRIVELAGVRECSRVLDVVTGTGAILRAAAERAARTATSLAST